MIYMTILLIWCLINIPITFIGWHLKANMFHVSLFFFAGVFLIICFGMIEAIKEDKKRGKIYGNV